VKKQAPWRVLLPAGIGTCLSLFGDSSLYAVLPTQTAAAGVSVASVGILLSANRFIRLVLNGPAGMAYDRWPRRPLFVSALFIGACSTAIYGLTQGFWPLLLGRLLWGLAWAGIWVGGNTIVLDIVDAKNRGRWIGMYQFSFFLGAAGGAMFGGMLTDLLGFHQNMIVGATLTLTGAFVALIFLPETRPSEPYHPEASGSSERVLVSRPGEKAEFLSISALYGANRLVIAGILMSTLGIFLKDQIGEQILVASHSIGVATLTGMASGLSTLIAMVSVTLMGSVSDRAENRWWVAAGGLVPGVVGFGLMALGLPVTILAGVPLIATTSGSNQGLSTALTGDIVNSSTQSRRLGMLFTVGDFASAIGPPLAYALMPLVGVTTLYLSSAVLFAIMFLISIQRATRATLKPMQR
jgi:MFS family permease